jgi:hypothetical protein
MDCKIIQNINDPKVAAPGVTPILVSALDNAPLRYICLLKCSWVVHYWVYVH